MKSDGPMRDSKDSAGRGVIALARVESANPDQSTTGIAPSLAELIGLRAAVLGRGVARRGRYGTSGPAASSLRGRGMEYAESREYVAGDDARHIDWRVTARTGRAHTKVFQAERERLTLIVADTAPSLYVGTRVRFKSVQAARAGAIAAWRAVRDGDRIAAMRGTTREAPVPPATGPRGALRVLDALTRWYAAPPVDDAGFDVALDHASRVLRPGSRLVALCDPASAQGIAMQRWTALAAHHDVVLVLLTDPLETAPPASTLAFRTGDERIELHLDSAAQRARWRARFVTPVETLLEQLPTRGVRVHVLSTDSASDGWLRTLDAPRRVAAP